MYTGTPRLLHSVNNVSHATRCSSDPNTYNLKRTTSSSRRNMYLSLILMFVLTSGRNPPFIRFIRFVRFVRFIRFIRFIRFVRFVFAPLRNRRFLPLNFGCIFFLMMMTMMMGPHNIQYACHLIFLFLRVNSSTTFAARTAACISECPAPWTWWGNWPRRKCPATAATQTCRPDTRARF